MPVLDWVILVIGTVLGFLSLTADMIGLGGFPGFGWKQVGGTAVALALLGVATTRIVRRGAGRRR